MATNLLREYLGAKGTDLGFDNRVRVGGEGYFVSVAELKLLRLIKDVASMHYNGIVRFDPILNEDSRPSYETLLDKTFLGDILSDRPVKRTYREVLEALHVRVEMLECRFYPSVYQGHITLEDLAFLGDKAQVLWRYWSGTSDGLLPDHPMKKSPYITPEGVINASLINATPASMLLPAELEGQRDQIYVAIRVSAEATEKITYDRKASGSHGEWGYKFLRQSLDHTPRPNDPPVVVSVYNGDGANNAPDRYIVEWMLKHNVPLVMVSTTKTGIDKKGGQIGVEFLPGGGVRVRMLELSSAKSNGKQDLFESVGLEGGAGEVDGQYFNTNIVLINYDLVSKILQDVLAEVFHGDAEQMERYFMPDIIVGRDKEGGAPGAKYTQLEGRSVLVC